MTEATESRRLVTLAALGEVSAADHMSAECQVQELIGSHPRDRGPMLDDPAITAEVRGVFRRAGATDAEAEALASALRWRRDDPTSKPEWNGKFDYPGWDGDYPDEHDWSVYADVQDGEFGHQRVLVSLNDRKELSPESADALAVVLAAAAATARALESGR